MRNLLTSLARVFWPELENMNEQRRLAGAGDVLMFLLIAPFAVAGLVWLVLASDTSIVLAAWPMLLLFGALIVIFNQLNYFLIVEIHTDRYGSAEGSLAGMVQWAAAFLYGPIALWLSVINSFVRFAWNLYRAPSTAARWNQWRAQAMEISNVTLAYLISLQVYARFGGKIPLSAPDTQAILAGSLALSAYFILVLIIWTPYIALAIWMQRVAISSTSIRPLLRFLIMALGLPTVANPFAILVAGLYFQQGLVVFIFISMGLLIVAYISRQLSWVAELSRQQTRQLEQLEHLSRDIITSPLDASRLSNLLDEHVPNMFPSGRVAIWLSSNQFLHRHPQEWSPEMEQIWDWVQDQRQAHAFLEGEPLPWNSAAIHHSPAIITPILEVDSNQPLGCVYIELRSLAQPWHRKALTALFPAAQSLAAQVASALHQARIYSESLEFQATLQELEFAGRIQASFLPNELPDLAGWELAVTLVPARETSGDFFDFIPLPDGRVGILVADVADKGLGAALYMALSRTLFRTYALEYEARPDIVFFSANERILQDARANLFVTAFYGILDPRLGTLTYSNAGHNPPFLINNQDGGTFTALTPTGIPIGVDPDATWTQEVIQIDPGAALILYTDGIPDAQNSDGSFYKERRLMEVALASINRPAQEIQAAILASVKEFVGKASQFDDITLLVLVRDVQAKEEEQSPPSEEIIEPQSEGNAVPELGTPSDRTGARSRWNSLGIGSGLRTPKRWSTRL